MAHPPCCKSIATSKSYKDGKPHATAASDAEQVDPGNDRGDHAASAQLPDHLPLHSLHSSASNADSCRNLEDAVTGAQMPSDGVLDLRPLGAFRVNGGVRSTDDTRAPFRHHRRRFEHFQGRETWAGNRKSPL